VSWQVDRLALSKDGHWLAGCSYEHRWLGLWRITGKQSSLVNSNWDSGLALLFQLAFSPDGLTLFAGGPGAQSVRPFDISVPTQPRSASEYSKTHIELRDAADGHLLSPALGTHDGFVTWLAFSPDGNTLASAGWEDGWIGVWDVPSRRQREKLRGTMVRFISWPVRRTA